MALVLGIESSCDETAAALVDGERRILAQRIASQEEAHAPYGGVVPEIAARAHAERLAPLIEGTLADAGLTLADCDAIAATAGPGLIGGVMVGLVTRQGAGDGQRQAADRDQPPRRACAEPAPRRSRARFSLCAAAGFGRALPDPAG